MSTMVPKCPKMDRSMSPWIAGDKLPTWIVKNCGGVLCAAARAPPRAAPRNIVGFGGQRCAALRARCSGTLYNSHKNVIRYPPQYVMGGFTGAKFQPTTIRKNKNTDCMDARRDDVWTHKMSWREVVEHTNNPCGSSPAFFWTCVLSIFPEYSPSPSFCCDNLSSLAADYIVD